MRTTIKDVANKTGYSITTVSLVLNDRNARISEKAKQKILECARSLDYRPNRLAIGIVTKRSRVLGLIIPDNTNQFFSSLSKAIEGAARKAGYLLIYGNTDNHAGRDIDYLQMYEDYHVDGIIYTKSSSDKTSDIEEVLRFLRQTSIPVVALDRPIADIGVMTVRLDHRAGGMIASRHLLERGHRRIGCLTGPLDLASSNDRLLGYQDALAEFGIPYDPALVVEGTYQAGREKDAVDRFLSQKATAVFSFNDIMALGLYRELQERGMRIPEDLSVVGFDNIQEGEVIRPALTSVSQPVEKMGAAAVRVLLEQIEGAKDKPDSGGSLFEFQPKLVVRNSVKTIVSEGVLK